MQTTHRRTPWRLSRSAAALLAVLALGTVTAQNSDRAGGAATAPELSVEEVRGELARIQSEIGTLIDRIGDSTMSDTRLTLESLDRQLRRSALRNARRSLVDIGQRLRSGDAVDPGAVAAEVERIRADVAAAYSAGRTGFAEMPSEADRVLDAYVRGLRAVEPTALDERARAELDERLRAVLDALDGAVAALDRNAAYRDAERSLRELGGGLAADPEAAASEVEDIRLAYRQAMGEAMSGAEQEFDLLLGRLARDLLAGRAGAYEPTYDAAVERAAALGAISNAAPRAADGGDAPEEDAGEDAEEAGSAAGPAAEDVGDEE